MPVASTPPVPPVTQPATSTPTSTPVKLVTPPQAFQVTCVNVDSMETAVQVLEDTTEKDPNVPGKMKQAPHACTRRVHTYKFELDPKPVSHPAVAVVISSLESLPFELKKDYILSIQPL